MSSVDLRAFETKIDSCIRQGEATEAHRLITRMLKLAEYSAESRLSASEYLRRISRHEEALRILRAEIKVTYNSKLSELDLRIHIQTLRLLNLLGASEFALKAITHYPTEIQKKYAGIFSEIYLSNYNYGKAYELLKGLENRNLKTLSYQERLRTVSIVDCWNGSERFEEAYALIEKLLELSPEPVLQAILHQVSATSLIGMGSPRKTLNQLMKAEKLFGKDQSTFDSAFVNKWYGIAYLKLSQHDLALAYFSKAWKVLYRPGFKPEAWLELLYYIGLVRFEKTAKIPQEWHRLLAYPGPNCRFTPKIIKAIGPQPDHFYTHETTSTKKAVPLIDSPSDVIIQRSNQKERHTIGLNSTDQIHYWLLLAGKYGIPYYRFFDILWNNESFSAPQFQKRFEQFLIRLRKEKIEISMAQHHLCLKNSPAHALWSDKKGIRGRPFLESHKEFQRKGVEDFFEISARNALSICQQWMEDGVVEKTKLGYRSLMDRFD